MSRIAVLNAQGHLIGAEEIPDGAETDMIDPGDLPLDGTYKWNAEAHTFFPLGHGFPRIGIKQPYSLEFVLARMVEAMGDNAPIEAKAWLGWFNDNLRTRQEETNLFFQRRG